MYKGEPTKGIDFYNLLTESDEFTSELGKVTLASGKLESELIILFKRSGINGSYERSTLGTLIDYAEKNKLLDRNVIMALKTTSKQRNYIMHNIYALFTDLIGETILDKNNLLDSDVHLYFERARQLNKNLNSLANIIKRTNETK